MYSPDPGTTPASIPVPSKATEMARSSQPVEIPVREEPRKPEPVQRPPEPAPQPAKPRITDFGVQQPQRKPRESELVPGMQRPMPEEELFEWTSPERPYKKHNRQFFTTIFMIALFLSLIFFFAGQLLTIAVVLAVAFLIYVLFTIPPGEVTHKLTTYGIKVEKNMYYWEEMGRFWFTDKYGQELVNIEIGRFPFHLSLLLGDIPKDTMRRILREVLLEEKPEATPYEKMASWLHKKIPIDIES